MMPTSRKDKMDIARDMLRQDPDVTNAEIDAALLDLCGERLHPEFTAKVRRELGIYKRGIALHLRTQPVPAPQPKPKEVTVQVSRKALQDAVVALQEQMRAHGIVEVVLTKDKVRLGEVQWQELLTHMEWK